MKKLFTILLLGVCISFCGCSKEETKCEHQYQSAVTTEASCGTVGIKTFTCTLCNDTYTEEIPVLEHTYTKEVTKEPTCAEKGVATYICAICNHTKKEDVETVAHIMGEAIVSKTPTCKEEGEQSASCTVCGATEVAGKIPVVEHTYKSKVSKEAACTTGGEETLTCSVCGNIKTESINKLGHDYKQKKVITKATCTKNGEKIMECTRCGDDYTETILAYGHDWIKASCTRAKHCANCAITEGKALGHQESNGKCLRCNIDLISLSVQSFPVICTYSNSYTGTVFTQVSVQDCTYQFSENDDGTYNLNISFQYVKTFDYKYNNSFRQTIFELHIYDSGNNEIYYEQIYDEAQVNQFFSRDLTLSNLESGEYSIVFTDYVLGA